MSKSLYTIVAFMLVCAINVQAQPICDFTGTSATPAMPWFNNSGIQYTTWSPGTHPWDIINTSSIGNPVGNPYVLHTNNGNGQNNYGSPLWLTSMPMTGFNWTYNELQWSFWFGRRANNGQNGGNQDVSAVWLYTNLPTGLGSTGTVGLEGIRVMWHHASNQDALRLSEIHDGIEYILGEFILLDNLSNYEWGTTVVVKRIPCGYPTGAEVRYELWMSTPDYTVPNFATYSIGADADAVAASIYKRLDTTLTSPWTPTSTTGRVAVFSEFSNSRGDAAEYNNLCFNDVGPAPVELTSFTASYRNGLVNLDWNTATETNNYGFEVQRSIERNGEWETIAFVDGHGTSNSPHDYRYTDDPNADGASLIGYRLKQIDRDGAYEYSNTILVTIAPKTTDVLYNFPNPFNPSTNISFTLLQDDVVTLKVFNTAGEMVTELFDNTEMNAGFHTIAFNGEGIPSGTYFYRLTTSLGTKTNSMVLSK